jgi:hypothetical protein
MVSTALLAGARQQRTRAESLPLLLVRPESFHNELARSYPVVYQYLITSYRLHSRAPFG